MNLGSEIVHRSDGGCVRPALHSASDFLAFERGKQDNVDMRKSLGPLIFLPIVIASLRWVAQTEATKEPLPPAPAGKEWKLIWHDEFTSGYTR
jgi:hypothetical protein